MNKEQLRMQMLAGIITESQYKEKMEEVDSMGKIGKSYPAPRSGSNKVELELNPQQKKVYEKAMIKSFKETKKEDGPDEAIHNLPYASKRILANIILGKDPQQHYFESDFDMEDELKEKGIDLDEFTDYYRKLQREVSRGSTNNPQIKDIQSWVKAMYD
jgi:hypothetical protein